MASIAYPKKRQIAATRKQRKEQQHERLKQSVKNISEITRPRLLTAYRLKLQLVCILMAHERQLTYFRVIKG
eukprot:scaffold72792_cov13-Prasinocladus_malaysianus.AAC.1